MTFLASSHALNARRICSEKGTPSRSRKDVIAVNVSLSGRNVMTLSRGDIRSYCHTNTTIVSAKSHTSARTVGLAAPTDRARPLTPPT